MSVVMKPLKCYGTQARFRQHLVATYKNTPDCTGGDFKLNNFSK